MTVLEPDADREARPHPSPSHREALLAFAAAPYERRAIPAVDDWPALLAAASRHRLIPLANHLLRRVDAPVEAKQLARAAALLQATQAAVQEREYGRALATLARAGVGTVVLKGPALARTVYPSPALRPSADLDVLVHQEDWENAHRALVEMGYQPLQALSAPPPKVAQHKAYYHMQYDREVDGLVHRVEVHYDLWWYGLRPVLGELYWRRAIPLWIGGVETRMVSPEDMLLHLCVHLHHHGYDRLIWFTDIALVLRSHGPSLDWGHIVRAAQVEGLGILVYYSLSYLKRLLGVSAPAWVFRALRPGPIQAWLHDRLYPPDDVLAVEVADRPLVDFHEVPEATELLLNFLLTGRRREKLAYLGRLIAPSDEWLAYYYATTDPAVLRRRRLTHAPTLLRNGLAELGDALCRGIPREALA